MENPQTNGPAVASLILGFCTWAVGCCGTLFGIGIIGLFTGVIGLVCGGIGVVQIRQSEAAGVQQPGMPFAIAGLVLNGLYVALQVLMIVLVIVGLGALIVVPELANDF
ncbi:MAG: hypothetical protein AAFV53_28015 [Myxococcota bacterium]